jgi:hypothetical protein
LEELVRWSSLDIVWVHLPWVAEKLAWTVPIGGVDRARLVHSCDVLS